MIAHLFDRKSQHNHGAEIETGPRPVVEADFSSILTDRQHRDLPIRRNGMPDV